MIVSVTGSSGFIGKWLVKRLIKDGHEVREWDRHIDREIANFELEGADFVVHLAAMRGGSHPTVLPRRSTKRLHFLVK